jgi:eukaryotic-like serine/threonine-protein kinase
MSIQARPRRLGPYDIVVKIAGGGMATIYLGRARDASGAERLAAVKVIRHDLRHDKRFVQMFLDEAKVLSRLSHPNVAGTHEFGTDDQQHFIAMELLVGRTLLDVWNALKERKLSLQLDHAAWIAARVAEGLHCAHELTDEHGAPLRVIHRDVNPSNIFLTFEGEVKLFDFGLAKSTGRQHADSSAGIVKGKLPYLSPEQVEQQPLDRRSDIFMLGTTLWELTTMRRLFVKDDDVDTLMAVRAGLVPDPRGRMPSYPEVLWNIVRRALARDREERYPTAEAFARDLDAFAASQGEEDWAAMTSDILDALFPGEREKRALWLKMANTPGTAARATMPPPVPLAGGDPGVPPIPSSRPPSSRQPPPLPSSRPPSIPPPPASSKKASSRPPPKRASSRPPSKGPRSSSKIRVRKG